MAMDIQDRNMNEMRRDLDSLRNDVTKMLAKFGEAAEERAEALSRQARQQVAEHPAASVGVAFGVGLVLGLALSAIRSR